MKTKPKISFFIFILYLSLIFTITSCKKSNLVEVENSIDAGRRDYTWTIDTLDMPMNNIEAIWGSSAEDIWVCGPGGGPPEWVQHYDGKKWTPYDKNGGIMAAGRTIFGFSHNDVWLAGQDGQIWHFDGTDWVLNYTYKAEGARDILIMNIWGNGSNDLYACGSTVYKGTTFEPEAVKGIVLHYDGHKWTELCKGDYNYQFLEIRKEQDKIYVFGYNVSAINSGEDIIAYYELNGNSLRQIYANTSRNIYMGNIRMLGDKLYFLIGHDICRFNDGNFSKVINCSDAMFGSDFSGRSTKDIFLRMNDGLAHYNGEDIKYLYHLQQGEILLHEPLIFDKDIFYSLWNPSKGENMVLHGKLK